MREPRGISLLLRREGAPHDLGSWGRNRPLAVGRDESVHADERDKAPIALFPSPQFCQHLADLFLRFLDLGKQLIHADG